MMAPDGTMGYNCYNCGFKTKFDGYDLGKNFESLMVWLGVPVDDIRKAKLELLHHKLEGNGPVQAERDLTFMRKFKEVPLPKGAVSLEKVASWDEIPDKYLQVIDYLSSRGNAVADNHVYYWSPISKNDMDSRLIIPFYFKDTVVGWTARYAGVPPHGAPRYYNSELQPGYLFNNDAMEKPSRKFVLLVEGPLDAIAIDGVAALGSELSTEQLAWLSSCDKEIVVVPDRQRKNQGLIDAAVANNWHVSFPEWEDKVKDAAQASARYGKIYTIRSILESKTDSPLKISVKRQMFKD